MSQADQLLGGIAWAEGLVREVFPDAEVVEVVPRTGGRLSAVYEVRCEDPAQGVILKVYAPEWTWKQAKEVHVYGMLAGLGSLPVPSVLHHTEQAGPEGGAVTVLSLLEGRPLSEAAEAAEELDGTRIASLYREMGSVLATIHQLGQEAYGYLTDRILEPSLDNGSYMRRQFAKKLAEFKALGGDGRLHDAVARRVARDGALFDTCERAVLCHNDLHEGNVLVARRAVGWELTGVIDVENAIAADPLIDLAKTDSYSLGRGEPERRALLEGYGPLPDDAAERLHLYRLYHALELWDWFRSIGTVGPLDGIADDIARLAERDVSLPWIRLA
ncbi:aminoglycoside phosphotransferase family protein [Streptacidiphilus pinicola]|uniref:Aminoglycoside phosphotransferase family protein n=1 Tax=Streptacidiphilus pinicola TaxID=2219663 RepID=A0A2X0K1D8_9ACTN|nr:aminoglycoside phosphotransferase family protein [Streptacidiphilus pinicola]RAG81349.1 aminoglycoside phosphotransferase family protein [Streptacidiphilus pinicola]